MANYEIILSFQRSWKYQFSINIKTTKMIKIGEEAVLNYTLKLHFNLTTYFEGNTWTYLPIQFQI